MAIPKGTKANLETLRRAFEDGSVALLEATRNDDGATVTLLCAVNRDGEEFAFVPLAEMCSGNPYEDYTPPL